MLDVMKMSLMHPEYQYRAFINKDISANVIFDLDQLLQFLYTHKKLYSWFFYIGWLILSIMALLYYIYLAYSYNLGWTIITLWIIAFVIWMWLSWKNAKFRHIGYFVIAFLLFNLFNLSNWPLLLCCLVWIISVLDYYLTVRIVLNILTKDKELFMQSIDNRLFTVYFDDDNINESEKFMKFEWINEVPRDQKLINEVFGGNINVKN